MTEMRSPLQDATPERQTAARLQFGQSVQEEHTRLLNRLQELIRQCNPLQMLAHFAFYDRALFEIQQGGNYQPLQQHAVEFFHAVFLTIPVAELKVRATPPEVILELNDVLRGLTMTFPMLGIGDGLKDNEQAKHAGSLAQMMRMNTHAVRNAGYYQQVMRQLKDVFGELDDRYFKVTGLKLSSLVTMCENILKLVERRLTTRMTALRHIRHCKTPTAIVSAYCDEFDLEEEDKIRLQAECTASNLSSDEAFAMCNHDADRRLIQNYTFDLNDFISAYGIAGDPQLLSTVLSNWSYPPEGLVGANQDHLFLNNPVWERPIIQLRPPQYFWPSPEIFHSFGMEMLEALLRQHPELFELYQNRIRPDYLEKRVAELCRTAFPTSSEVWVNCEWYGPGGARYETDILILFDRIALAIECKSARITAKARRGTPERLHREVKKLVEEPSRQTARLAELLLSSNDGVTIQCATGTHHIAPHRIRKVIRLNITLDFLGPIACAVREMLAAHLIDPSIATAPTVALVDFENVLHVLERPITRLHYFARRSEIERNVDLFADEEDLLACYLATGMNFGEAEFTEDLRLMLGPMGQELQPYLMAYHAGKPATKPRRRFIGWWRQLLDTIEAKGFDHWTLIGFALLDVRHEEQRGFQKMTRKMLKTVRSNWRSADCSNSVLLANGPKQRRTAVVSLGIKRATREERWQKMQRAARIAGEKAETDAIVMICLDAENTFWPYTAIGYSDYALTDN